MNQIEQLAQDGNLLSRPKPNGKAPRKPLPKMSAKRQREARIYLVKRNAFLAAHPKCMAIDRILDWLNENDEATFFAKDTPAYYVTPSEEIHHTRKPKQTYFLDESTWLAVSRWSHNWIEQNKSIARTLGLLR